MGAPGSLVVKNKIISKSSIKMMLILLASFSAFTFLLYLMGTNMGPPRIKQNAEAYLRSIGAPSKLIWALWNSTEINASDIDYLLSVPDPSVRYLLAMNSSLSKEQRLLLWNDPDEKVKCGVAANRALTREEIECIIRANIKSTFNYLATNRSVPQDILLDLFYSKKADSLFSFALNPNCPEEIKEVIRKSNNYNAKSYLKRFHDNHDL